MTPGCNCRSLFEQLNGKCIVFTLAGIVSHDGPHDCACCEDYNGAWRATRIVTFIGCDESFYTGCTADTSAGATHLNGEVDCLCFEPSGGLVIGLNMQLRCDGTVSFDVGALLSTFDFAASSFWGYSAFGFGTDDRAEVQDLIERLVHGEAVEVPLTESHLEGDPLDCYGDSPTLTMQLAEGEDCESSEPPVGDCTPFDDCDTMSIMVLRLSGFENCTVPDDGGGHPYLEAWLSENLNGFYVLNPADEYASPSCVTPTNQHFYLPIGDFDSATAEERFTDPGILWHKETYADSHEIWFYACALALEVSCSAGNVTIDKMSILEQGFQFSWTGTEFDYSTVSFYFSPICRDYNSPSNQIGAPAGACNSSGVSACSSFDYDKCGTTKKFTACGVVGPVF